MTYHLYKLDYGGLGVYVGSTGDPKNRLKYHKYCLRKRKTLPDRLLLLSRSFDHAQHPMTPTMEVLRTFELKSAAQAAERVLIAHEAELDAARAGLPILVNTAGTVRNTRSVKSTEICPAHGEMTVYSYPGGRIARHCVGCRRERNAAAGLPAGPNPPPTSSRRRHDTSTLTSPYTGVQRRPAKRPTSKEWLATVSIGGATRYLGLHRTEEEAARAYDDAVMLHKLDRLLNFPGAAAAPQPPELDGQLSLLDNTDNNTTEPKDA